MLAIVLRTFQTLVVALVWLVAIGCGAWAAGAIAFDFPAAALRTPLSVGFGLALAAAAVLLRGRWRKLAAIGAGFGLVLAWWLTLKPSNDRDWQPDLARVASAKIEGDSVTFQNVRNCEYRTETEFTPRWGSRTVRLSQITAVDIAINYWGSPWMAHPIVSFQFADAPPLCFSIETRKEKGEAYSAIGGIYRQYELIYVVSEERDVIRVRTNFRKGEDVYLHRTTIKPEKARERFMEYVRAVNHLAEHPHWYNAVTTNCTTSIRTQRSPAIRAAWDWRMLLNGKGDEMMYERGDLVTGGLPFAELKRRSRINDVAQSADQDPDFSQRIRANLPFQLGR